MEKLKMHSMSKIDENVKKIAALFPECITEIVNDKGELKKVVDIDAFKQLFSKTAVEGNQERYQFTWPDKRKAKALVNQEVTSTLRPCREESVNFDTTENLYIEGDNLEVLKLLQETYLGTIKMIYIDPPYNTGHDFVYNDDFSQDRNVYIGNSGQIDEAGNRLGILTESYGRFHTDWLNMMYPRLWLAKDLLTEDGVIFISIDDNEQENLRKMCDEIFGEENFIAQLVVQLNPRGRNLDRFVAKTHESILVYGKNAMLNSTISGIEKEGRMVDEYNKEDEHGRYRLIGLRNRNQSFNPITRPNLYYPLYVSPTTKKVSTIRSEEYCDEVFPDTPDGTKTCWTWMRTKVEKENYLITAEKTGAEWRIYRKDYLLNEDGSSATTLVKSIWLDNEINNDYGKKAIKELFGNNVMSFPKPPVLIEKLLKIGMGKNDIVLDFFSGSATTAHAVIKLNAEDDGHRKFIMVQLPEKCDEHSEAYKAGYQNICEIGKERIRRAGKQILDELKNKNGDLFAEETSLDVGFRDLKLDSSNMNDVYYTPDALDQDMLDGLVSNIKEDRTAEDLLFQVMLDLGVFLSAKIVEDNIGGKKIFNVNNNYLIACFDENVTDDMIVEIAKRHPDYFVMRDSSLANDSVSINFDQIFERYRDEKNKKKTERKIL